MEFSFGIEHEVAFLDHEGRFADFSRTSYADFDQIIEQLPLYPGDYDHLRRGDAGIKKKRWYIECFERFKDDDKVINCHPKGIEIRTTIHPSIRGAIAELSSSYDLLVETAQQCGYTPVCVAYNPYQTVFEPDPPLNEYEIGVQHQSPEMFTQGIAMLTYGPDLNLSIKDMTAEQMIDLGQKLTHYSPYLVPFSFNAPFYGGQLWEGLSARTFFRTGARPAALVFVAEPEQLIRSKPSLTTLARLPAEVGRIEFKAFDVCPDFSLYAGLLALLKGLALDRLLPDRATTPDAALHQLSARCGFDSQRLYLMALAVIEAVDIALAGDPDHALLEPLTQSMIERKSPAHRLIEKYQQYGTIEGALLDRVLATTTPVQS
ncbi:MAG: glutamate--cysteine ligase [Anaerolineales bacterium]|nr:glutamate--cysteine ligase [Anaerolineales bacterium]